MMYTATLETYEKLINEQMSIEQLPMPMERRFPQFLSLVSLF